MATGHELRAMCKSYGFRQHVYIGNEVMPSATVAIFDANDRLVATAISQMNSNRALARSQISYLRERVLRELRKLESRQSISPAPQGQPEGGLT